METCKDLAGERCHAPGREQDRKKPLHENACAPNKKLRIFILTPDITQYNNYRLFQKKMAALIE